VDPKDVDITVTEDTLTIKGEARTEQEEKGRNYYRRELRYGSFLRTLALPEEVQGDKARATYRNGILEIRVPKSERARPRTVKVEVAD
jgi:HSP20 family protein